MPEKFEEEIEEILGKNQEIPSKLSRSNKSSQKSFMEEISFWFLDATTRRLGPFTFMRLIIGIVLSVLFTFITRIYLFSVLTLFFATMIFILVSVPRVRTNRIDNPISIKSILKIFRFQK
ncbi:MAG: hypothetical protein ACJ0BB_00160 [Dehalococcoidia bacterium]|mgnify:FL=1|tara:strand:+ start:1561 stop:1920 length:360 start_codon:yes stop_codon:yes gene_type:complete